MKANQNIKVLSGQNIASNDESLEDSTNTCAPDKPLQNKKDYLLNWDYDGDAAKINMDVCQRIVKIFNESATYRG